MGTPRPPVPVKRIVGILAASEELLAEVRQVLAGTLAPIELSSRAFAWRLSRYYEGEMGSDIWRQYLALEDTMVPEELVQLKHETNALEERWRDRRGRRANIDPGYLDLTKLVLASTKDAAHRIYLGEGIYAEATLRYADAGFAPWPYTYPDYALPETCAFFNQVRARYRAWLRRSGRRPGPRVRRGSSAVP